jgi:hypothetical protein
MDRQFDALHQHRILQPCALVAPGLADLDGPFLILRAVLGVDLEDAVRIAELRRLDDAGDLECLVFRPVPTVVGASNDRDEQRSKRAAKDNASVRHGSVSPGCCHANATA